MSLCKTLSVCVLLTVAALAIKHSDNGLSTEDSSDGQTVETAADTKTHRHTRQKPDKSEPKCKKKKSKPKAGGGLVSNALGPISSRAGAARDFEDLSIVSSLNPNFWVREKLPNITVDANWNENADCFYGSRKSMRHYPTIPGNACYTRQFAPRMNSWWNFWPEIRGDLQYAFDFVMWDEYEPYHATNSFWYLMLYLKTLLTAVPNPNHIATKAGAGDEPRPEIKTIMPPESMDANEIHELLKEYHEKLDHLENLIVDII